MSRHTLRISISSAMRAYLDSRVSAGHYGNASEYLRELVRRDQEALRQRLRELIEEGLASGPNSPTPNASLATGNPARRWVHLACKSA